MPVVPPRSPAAFSRILLALALTPLLAALAGCSSAARERAAVQEALAAARRAAPAPAAGRGVEALGPVDVEVLLAPTPLRGANGLACREGRLFVAAAAGGAIAEVFPDGRVSLLPVPAEIGAPDDLVAAADGSLLVTSMRPGAVWRRDPEGGWTRIAERLPGANGIALGPGGRLFASQCLLGDALVELSSDGSAPPREIARDLGCPNAFFVDPSGALVVPLLERGEVVRVDPATGAKTVLASGLAAPTAAKADPRGGALVLEGATGEIIRLRDGRITPVARLRRGLDNLTPCGESLLVSSYADGSITQIKPWPGSPTTLLRGGLVTARALVARPDGLLVADGVSIKRIRRGRAELVAAILADPIAMPVGLAAGPGGDLYLSSPERGVVQRFDPRTGAVETVADALEWPTSLALTTTGDLLVVETGAGRVLRIATDGLRSEVAHGLLSPVGLALSGEQVLTAEPEGGRVLALHEGSPPSVVATGLAGPAGLAADRRGGIWIVEARAGRLLRIGPGGVAAPIAAGLAVAPSPGPHPLPVGVATDGQGGVIVASPLDGSVLRFVPR